jgi:hypothetical protein
MLILLAIGKLIADLSYPKASFADMLINIMEGVLTCKFIENKEELSWQRF